ncbi:MAG: glycosyltransferase, partial [Gemmatimonadota bacterium]
RLDPGLVSREGALDLRRSLGLGPGDVVATMVSRVIRSKGVLEFAAAAEALREDNPNLRFLLVGPVDGGSLDRLTREELSLVTSRVRWIGMRDDIREILAASDLFVLPTQYREGVPRVLMEAASMCLPLVATRSGGCGEIVRDGENGWLVEPGRHSDLVGAVARLAGDRSLRQRFGAASRSIAVDEFDYRVTARKTAALYWRLLEDGRRAPAHVALREARPARAARPRKVISG